SSHLSLHQDLWHVVCSRSHNCWRASAATFTKGHTNENSGNICACTLSFCLSLELANCGTEARRSSDAFPGLARHFRFKAWYGWPCASGGCFQERRHLQRQTRDPGVDCNECNPGQPRRLLHLLPHSI